MGDVYTNWMWRCGDEPCSPILESRDGADRSTGRHDEAVLHFFPYDGSAHDWEPVTE